MPCDECRELNTHTFRSHADLVHALREASVEVDRGVLRPLPTGELGASERKALTSFLDAHALPNAIRYRFQCTVCGDRFDLFADTQEGAGGWLREGEGDLPDKGG